VNVTRAALDPDAAVRVIEAFKVSMSVSASPFEALVAASRQRLGPFGETDAFARVVFALARDFDAQHGTTIVRDPVPLARVIEGYVGAIEGIRHSGSWTMNLPYLSATGNGPVHFQRTLTARDVADLVAKDPAAPQPRKKGWWPFG